MTQFSDTTNNTGILEQVRVMMRVDATQWPTANVVNSCNNWLDTITGYAIGADRRFQWDDTNHTELPIGTTDLMSTQSDYSFLTDEQGNTILTLWRIEVKDSSGRWTELKTIDEDEIKDALVNFQPTSGTPIYYDKIADNIVRLYPTPSATVSSGLKFYFQRSPSYFAATDTTKKPGFAPTLHRGFVIASAYDGAMTLGLSNIQPLSVERQVEMDKMIKYFAGRNNDEKRSMRPNVESCR